jgi:hypothetical protein
MDWGAFTYRDGVLSKRKHFMFNPALAGGLSSASGSTLLTFWNPAAHMMTAVLVNTCLRLTWTSRYVRHGMSEAARAFLLIVLEVVRRSIWFIFRIEHEIYQRDEQRQLPQSQLDVNNDA